MSLRTRLQHLLADGGPARLLASAVSGVLLVFISAPANIHWMHWLSFVPMLWAMRPNDHKRNGAVAWFGGWIAIFILYFWIIETIIRFSNVPWILAFLLHLVFTTLFSLPYLVMGRFTAWFREKFGLLWVFALPALWVSLEMIPTLFPYYHGVSQYRFPPTWQLASVLGVTGLTFLVWWSNAIAAEFLYRRQEGRSMPWAMLGAFVVVFASNIMFGVSREEAVEAALAEAPVMRTALIQHDVTMEERLREHPAKTTKAWVESTRAVLDQAPDLVIWPEGAILYNPDEERQATWLGDQSPKQFFMNWTRDRNFHLLVGGGTWEVHDGPDGTPAVTSYNSAYAFDRKGALVGRYDKMIPLPFGEYIPFADTFPWIADQIEGVGDFRAGSVPTVFPATTGEGVPYTYSVPICYEAILTQAMWWLYEGTEAEPVDLFVVITNDAWFGNTSSPHQHAMLTTAQAMQFGRPMIRSAYTGVSWVVEPHGHIVGETGVFEDVATVEEVRMASFDTLFVQGGWVFPYLCIAGTFVLIGIGYLRDRSGSPAAAAEPVSEPSTTDPAQPSA
jgi:apolipoprotein N-acyltransferase